MGRGNEPRVTPTRGRIASSYSSPTNHIVS